MIFVVLLITGPGTAAVSAASAAAATFNIYYCYFLWKCEILLAFSSSAAESFRHILYLFKDSAM